MKNTDAVISRFNSVLGAFVDTMPRHMWSDLKTSDSRNQPKSAASAPSNSTIVAEIKGTGATKTKQNQNDDATRKRKKNDSDAQPEEPLGKAGKAAKKATSTPAPMIDVHGNPSEVAKTFFKAFAAKARVSEAEPSKEAHDDDDDENEEEATPASSLPKAKVDEKHAASAAAAAAAAAADDDGDSTRPASSKTQTGLKKKGGVQAEKDLESAAADAKKKNKSKASVREKKAQRQKTKLNKSTQKQKKCKAPADSESQDSNAAVDTRKKIQPPSGTSKPGLKELARLIAKKRADETGTVVASDNVDIGEFEYGNVDFDGTLGSEVGLKTVGVGSKSGVAKKTKGPSIRNYKAHLDRIQQKKKELDDLKSTDETAATALLEKRAWSKAMKQASGVKIQDDEERVAKALERKIKLKERSRVQWAERKDSVKKEMDSRQKRRTANIQKRASVKLENKIKKRKRKC